MERKVGSKGGDRKGGGKERKREKRRKKKGREKEKKSEEEGREGKEGRGGEDEKGKKGGKEKRGEGKRKGREGVKGKEMNKRKGGGEREKGEKEIRKEIGGGGEKEGKEGEEEKEEREGRGRKRGREGRGGWGEKGKGRAREKRKGKENGGGRERGLREGGEEKGNRGKGEGGEKGKDGKKRRRKRERIKEGRGRRRGREGKGKERKGCTVIGEEKKEKEEMKKKRERKGSKKRGKKERGMEEKKKREEERGGEGVRRARRGEEGRKRRRGKGKGKGRGGKSGGVKRKGGGRKERGKIERKGKGGTKGEKKKKEKRGTKVRAKEERGKEKGEKEKEKRRGKGEGKREEEKVKEEKRIKKEKERKKGRKGGERRKNEKVEVKGGKGKLGKKRQEESEWKKWENQRAFVGGSWSDSGEEEDEKIQDKTYLVAQAPNECRVTFYEHDSEITKDGKVIGRGIRKKGLYVMKLGNKPKDKICLATIDENSTLWHRRLGHANMRLIQSLASKELVRNLPKLKFDQHFCDACKIGKQAHVSHKAKNIVSTTRCLELLHMDLFGPSAVRSYGGNRYTLVIVDDYSRYTWTRFLKDKTEAFDQFEIFSKKIQNQLGCTIVSIRTDHGREFDNEVQFGEFCNANEPKNVNEALGDESWIVAMQEELNQFIANDVWELVPQPKNMTIIGTKWVFRNKLDENDVFLEIRLDNTLFTKKKSSNLIIVQIYVDDIIFGLTCQDMCDEFAKIMHDEFEMSMMGELNFFLGLQIKQMKDGIFFNQSKYIKEMLKKLGLEDSKPIKTPTSSDTKLTKDEECESVDSTKYRGMIGTTHLGLWYPKGTGIETVVYADSDHAGDYVDRKSTSGICTFVGCCLTSWFSKKQTALAISTTEAEYVSARKACQQALWMKQALIDYDKGHISIEKVPSVDNIADILTKPLKRESFNYLLGVWYFFGWSISHQPPSINDIISSIRIDREGQVRRIRHEEQIDVLEYQILTCKIVSTLKPLEEIIRENVFCLGGNWDHVPACLCFMLYCVVYSEKFNLAYYMAKRMEWVTKQARLILPYGMLLTRLFKFIMNEYLELYNESYVLYDRVMNPLAAQLERKTRKDRGTRRGRHSTSSSTFDQPSSSHLNDDDDDGNDEGTSRASTPSPIRYVNSLTNEVP
ncbi:retrovirus-related pol polyprotein from transposon TNT 1-94 [Tanacetum coccineum]